MNIRSYKQIEPTLADGVYVDPMACVIGDVHLGKDSSVWPMAVIRGDVHKIRIGNECSIQDGSVLHVTHDGPYSPGGRALILGDRVTVGHNVTLHACTIDDRVLIGMGCIVLDGAHIQSDVLLGAGAMVPPNKVLESGYLYVGSPVKKLRPLDPKELEFLNYTAKKYAGLKNDYLK
ncbi:MAG: gamma carbonic anhydrase family protein [Enterobacterales bacterium]|nr:gamma carbonic anhydrase family protein [Enterobacterales bacterium]